MAYSYITNEKTWPDQTPERKFGIGDKVFAFMGEIMEGEIIAISLVQNLDDGSYLWEYTADFHALGKPVRVMGEEKDFRYNIRFVKWNEDGKRYLFEEILNRMFDEEEKFNRVMGKLTESLRTVMK